MSMISEVMDKREEGGVYPRAIFFQVLLLYWQSIQANTSRMILLPILQVLDIEPNLP